MAVLDQLHGVEIHLGVNSRYLTEYPDDDYDTQGLAVSSTYVESIASQQFQVCLLVSTPFELHECSGIQFAISINGKMVRTPLILKEDYDRNKRWTANLSGVKEAVVTNGTCISKKFTFSKIGISKYHATHDVFGVFILI
jgi:hypothetical protein